LEALKSCGAWSSAPSLGRLILAAHSGGGHPLYTIAAANGELADHLVEVWMLDALYGQVAGWARYLGAQPQLVARFTYYGTRDNCQTLAKSARGPHVDIRATRAPGHCQVPRDDFGDLLAQSVLEPR
jgi:hypothetical protein